MLCSFCLFQDILQKEPLHLRPRRQVSLQNFNGHQFGALSDNYAWPDHNLNNGINDPNFGHNNYYYQSEGVPANSYQHNGMVANGAYNVYDYENTAISHQPRVGYYNGFGGSVNNHAGNTGFKSPAQFETLLVEDNTGDYINYDNHHYDVNFVHSHDGGLNTHNHGVAAAGNAERGHIHKHGNGKYHINSHFTQWS